MVEKRAKRSVKKKGRARKKAATPRKKTTAKTRAPAKKSVAKRAPSKKGKKTVAKKRAPSTKGKKKAVAQKSTPAKKTAATKRAPAKKTVARKSAPTKTSSVAKTSAPKPAAKAPAKPKPPKMKSPTPASASSTIEVDISDMETAPPFVVPSVPEIPALPAIAPPPPTPPPLPTEPRLPSTCSQGGPVIAISAELASAWRGTLPPIGAVVPPDWKWGNSGGPICDYDRICEWGIYSIRTDYGGVGVIPVADGLAIALDAEIVTSWMALPDGGAILRSGTALRESDGRVLLERAAAQGFQPLASTITLLDGRLFLFDSAYAGAADPSQIRAFDGVAVGTPGPGTYSMQVASFEGNDVIRLTRI